MRTIKLFEDFIMEKTGDTYDYGCVMLYFNFDQLEEIHAKIDQEDLYVEENDRTFGLEDEPHVTLLYGLHNDVTLDRIKNVIGNSTFDKLVLHNVSLFENEYDVLKLDIRYPTRGGAFLHKCNKDLAKLPHTNSYPDYHPHCTIAYLKKGMGAKYVEMFNELEYNIEPTHVVYSHADGEKTEIKIN